MAKRLVKIAKELNVGTSTIVEYLNKNGFDIENKPTAKVSAEMENALLREYQASKEVKEKADKMNIRQNVPAPPKKESKLSFDLPKPGIPSLKTKATPPSLTPTPKKEEPVVPTLKVEEPPKVEEKIEKVELPKVETPVAPPKVEEKKEELQKPVEDKEVKTTSASSLKVVGKIDLDALKKKPKKKKPAAKKEEKPEPAEKKVEAPKEEAPKPQAKKEEIVPEKEAPKEEPKPSASEAPKENLMVRAKTPQLEGLKVKGKINLDKFATKPKKKDEKKPGESDPAKKRRRKRKKVPTGTKPVGESKRSDSQVRRKRGDNNKRPVRGKGKDDVKEVSKKEIEERIKATKAALSGGGKNKRQNIRRDSRQKKREAEELREIENRDERLQLTEFISVSELASLMGVSPTEVITSCMNLGYFVTLNQRLDAEVIEIVASEFNHEVVFVDAEEALEEEEEIIDDPKDLKPRAPIVTVMGHVDHGKTSLLDFVRSANVADGEAGGITQHIGAYEVFVSGEDGEKKKVTFLDTPGHEAFTAMRARGAKVTDVAIIIISADDKIMPQTKEAISHAQAAEVPMVFAINKIDKPGADPERIKSELAQMNLLVEDWGGEYQSQDISAKHGTNIDELLEKILLQAEMLELKANPERLTNGVILEAALDKGRGYVAKMLVQNGSMKVGDPIVAGAYSGKVKAMFNERGKRIKVAGPSTPVLVLGLNGAPQAGEKFKEMENEQDAKALANKRSILAREQANRANKRISLEDIGRRLALDSFKELNLIIKGDTDGSIEALADSLMKQSIETVQVNVIHKAVGQIIESDVLLASASDAIIIGFQVRPSASARKSAEREGVQIKTYSIIYEAIDQVRSAIEGMLEPTQEEKIVGEAEIRQTFKVNRVGTIAGCFVTSGKITRNSKVRVIRNGIVTYPLKENQVGELASLKRFKDDAKEVKNNMECGMSIKNFNDIKVGDVIEAYEIVSVKQTLD